VINYSFGDNTNWRAVFSNEKHEFSAGCTEDKRAGRRAAQKGRLHKKAVCNKGHPSSLPVSAAQLNVQPARLP